MKKIHPTLVGVSLVVLIYLVLTGTIFERGLFIDIIFCVFVFIGMYECIYIIRYVPENEGSCILCGKVVDETEQVEGYCHFCRTVSLIMNDRFFDISLFADNKDDLKIEVIK